MRFLAFLLLLASTLLSRADHPLVGRWEGSAQIPDSELPLIIDLAREGGGAWKGSVIIPGFNVAGAPLTNIAVKDSDASFTIKTGSGLEAFVSFHLSADGTLAGDFIQAGNHAPLILKKIGPPQVEVAPRSSAITKEFEGEWKGDYELFGYPRHVTIKIASHEDKGATAEFVVIGKKTNNLPVSLVTQEGSLLSVDSGETNISYEGRLNKEANEIKGTFAQGPLEAPLILRRVP